MAATDIAALLSKQQTLAEGVARLTKLTKESAYHSKQASRKAAEAAELAKANAALQAELDAVSGKDANPPTKEEKPVKK